MNKTSFLTFFSEVLAFIFLVFMFQYVWGLSSQSKIFLCAIFIFSWLYTYKKSQLLFHYLSHLISIFLISFFVILIVAITLKKPSHIFFVGGSSIICWLLVSCVMRLFWMKFYFLPYTVLIHSDIQENVSSSSKVNLCAKNKVCAEDIKNISAIVVDNSFSYDEEWQSLIFQATISDIPIIDINKYEELIEQRLSSEQLKSNFMFSEFKIPVWYRLLRNISDFIVSFLLLPILLPVFILVSFLILIKMGRPIFFTQYRIGMNGKKFKIYKFRSMVKDAESGGMKMASSNDKRITNFGNFIRKFRIDELPQFINVLKGDMSIIGPRPEQEALVKSFVKDMPLYNFRHTLRPGITGYAQVKQGYASNSNETKIKLQYDLYYIKNYSMTLDIKIVLKTIYTILTGFGAK